MGWRPITAAVEDATDRRPLEAVSVAPSRPCRSLDWLHGQKLSPQTLWLALGTEDCGQRGRMVDALGVRWCLVKG